MMVVPIMARVIHHGKSSIMVPKSDSFFSGRVDLIRMEISRFSAVFRGPRVARYGSEEGWAPRPTRLRTLHPFSSG